MKNSIISKLKAEGVLKLYHDYRAGHLNDLSGNGNNGTFLGTPVFNVNGLFTDVTTTGVSIPDVAALRLTTGTIIGFFAGGVQRQEVSSQTIYSKRDVGGTNIQFYFSATGIALYAGAVHGLSALATTVRHKKYLAANFVSGAAPNFYTDGIFAGAGTNILNTDADDAAINTCTSYTSNQQIRNTLSAVIVCSRVLTATEHALLYSELSQQKWPTKPLTLASRSEANNNILVDGDMEAATTAAWTAGSGATLTKESGARTGGAGLKVLRITNVDFTSASQIVLTVNKAYRVTGWARGDGAARPSIRQGGSTLWLGVTSTTWQYFDVSFICTNASLGLGRINATGSYAEFDDIVVTRVPPKVDTNIHLEGAPVSVAARGGAIGQYLENTPFQFGDATGRYSVSTDTVLGKANTKVISCSTAGLLYMPSTQAYGEWSMDIYLPNTGANNDILHIADTIGTRDATGQDGYYTRVSGDIGSVAVGESTNGTPLNKFTAVGTFIHSTWHELKFIRTAAGVTTVYKNSIVIPLTGENPFTDTSITTSTYFVMLLAAGAKVANILFKPLA